MHVERNLLHYKMIKSNSKGFLFGHSVNMHYFLKEIYFSFWKLTREQSTQLHVELHQKKELYKLLFLKAKN